MEVRAAPLVWLGSKLGEPLGFLPIVSGKLSWRKYQESRTVGYDADADTNEKQETAQEPASTKAKSPPNSSTKPWKRLRWTR